MNTQRRRSFLSLPQQFDEPPKLDRFFRPSAVFVVSIPLAYWRAAASAMHPTDFPASYRWRAAPLAGSL